MAHNGHNFGSPVVSAASWRAWPKLLLIALVLLGVTLPVVGCHFMPFLARPTMAGKAKLPTGSLSGGAQAGVAPGSMGVSGAGGILSPGQNFDSGLIVPNLDPNAVPVPGLPTTTESKAARPIVLKGRLDNPHSAGRTVQAVPNDVIKEATITILDLGNRAVASTLTQADGTFSLTLNNFTPADGGYFVVEASKALGGPGGEAVRFRTIVQYSQAGQGWLSVTNSAVGTPQINALTTAVAIEVGLDSAINKALAIGKVDVSGATPKIRNGSAILGSHLDKELTDLAQDILTYLLGDLDPIASVPAIKPSITDLEPGKGYVGSLVKIRGSGFSPVLGGSTVKFGGATATSVFLLTPTLIVVGVPGGATSGDVTVATTRGGTSTGKYFEVTGGLQVEVKTLGIEAPFYVGGAELTAQRGSRKVTLYPGTAQIVFTTGQAATFIVSQDGSVDASMSGGALTGGAGLVSFVVKDLEVRPGDYQGTYNLSGGFMPSYVIGNSTVKVLKGLGNYQMVAGAPHLFNIGPDGTVYSGMNWAIDDTDKLTFNNKRVSVQAGSYAGTWSISGVTPSSQTGSLGIYIPMDTRNYVFNVMGTSFAFDVDGVGGVVIPQSSDYADGGASIRLKIGNVTIDTKKYMGQFSITGITGWVSGNQDLFMLEGLIYRITFWPGNAYVTFKLEAGGVTVDSAGGGASTDALTVSPGSKKLEFATRKVDVASGEWQGNWGILYGQKAGSWTWLMTDTEKPNWVRGDDSYTMLKGLTNYYFIYFYPGTIDHYINVNLSSNGSIQEIGRGAKVGTGVVTLTTDKITFNTLEVPVNTSRWLGSWGLYYGDSPSRGWTWLPTTANEVTWVSGDRRSKLLMGLRDYYFLQFWPGNSKYYLPFDIDGNGAITLKPFAGSPVTGGAVTVVSGNTLTFSTVDFNSDVNGWRGSHGLLYGESSAKGWGFLRTTELDTGWVAADKTWTLLRGITNYYFLYVYPGGVDYFINMNLGAGDTFVYVDKGANISRDIVAFGSKTFSFNTKVFTVETKGFLGNWGIYYGDSPQRGWTWLPNDLNQTGWVTEDRSVTLLKGMVGYYFLQFWPGNNTHYLLLSVTASGGLTYQANGGPVTASVITTSDGKITFNTVDMVSDTGGWRGSYGLWYGESPQRGWTWLRSTDLDGGWVSWAAGPSSPHKTWKLLRGIKNYYFMYLYPGGTDYYINVNLDGADKFASVEVAPRMSASTFDFTTAGKFSFKTQPVTVDNASYQGNWGVYYGDSPQRGWGWLPNDLVQTGWVSGSRGFKVLKGMTDYCSLHFYPGNNVYYLELSASSTGALSAKKPTGGPVEVGAISFPVAGQIKFNTTPINSNVGGYLGNHDLWYGESPQRGWTVLRTTANDGGYVTANKTWYLIQGIKNYYFLYFYPGGADYQLNLNLALDGALTRVDSGANVTYDVLKPATGNLGSTLTFNTVNVSTNTNGFPGNYQFLYGNSPQIGWTTLRTNELDGGWVASTPTSPTNPHKTWTMVRGLLNYYHLYYYPGGADYAQPLNLGATGGLSRATVEGIGAKVTSGVLTPASGDLGTTLAFNVATVTMDTNGWTGSYEFLYGNSAQLGWTALRTTDYDGSWVACAGAGVPCNPHKTWKMLRGLTEYYFLYLYPGGVDYALSFNLGTTGGLTHVSGGAGNSVSGSVLTTSTGDATLALKFNTTAATNVDNNGWGGNYGMYYGNSPQIGWTWLYDTQNRSGWFIGQRAYRFLKGVKNYYHFHFYPGGNFWVTLDVNASGTMTTTDAGPSATKDAITVVGNAPQINAADVTLADGGTGGTLPDGGWHGNFGIQYGSGTWLPTKDAQFPNWIRFSNTYRIVRGLSDYFYLVFYPGGSDYMLNFDAQGTGATTTLTTGTAGSAVSAGVVAPTANTMTLKTTRVTFQPGSYLGLWALRYGNPNTNSYTYVQSDQNPDWQRQYPTILANRLYDVLMGMTNYYVFTLYPGRVEHNLGLNVDSSGNLTKNGNYGDATTTNVLTPGGTGGRTVTLNTQTVKVNPGTGTDFYTGLHGMQYGGSFLNYYDRGPKLEGGWYYLTNGSNSATWVSSSDETQNTWTMLKGTKSYYLHGFYPISTNFYRVMDLSSTGAVTFKDGDRIFAGTANTTESSFRPTAAVTVGGTTTLTLNTAEVLVENNNYRGYWDLMYGDVNKGLNYLRDTQNNLTTVVTNVDRSYRVLKGIVDYYTFRPYPGLNFFAGLDYRSDSKFYYMAASSGTEASINMFNLATANKVRLRTYQVSATRPLGLGAGTWKMQYGDGPPSTVVDLADINGLVDQPYTVLTQKWYVLAGIRNYFWMRTSDSNLGGGFGTTGTLDAPVPARVYVGTRYSDLTKATATSP